MFVGIDGADQGHRTTSAGVSLGDLDRDGDGDLDLVASNDWPDEKLVYLNDGSGRFRVSSTFGASTWTTRYVTVADLNGDHRPDLLVANRSGGTGTDKPSYACMNDGQGAFPSCTAIATESATIIVAADLDGDGATDLFVPHRDGGRNRILWNDGRGGFTVAPTLIGPDSSRIRAAAADIDGDGVTGLVVGDERAGLFIYYGARSRRFETPQAIGGSASSPYSIAIADLDRDGALDIVVGNDRAPGLLLFNTAGGKRLPFTTARWNDGQGAVYAVAVGDLDGDGWPDIAAARSDAPNGVWFSDAAPRRAVPR